MYTSAELALLRAVDHNAVLPGIDTETGNQDPSASLLQLSALPVGLPFSYDAAENIVRVIENGAVLNGINFGSAEVMIEANNVTIENCTFTATTGWYSVYQVAGYSGAVVQNCTFNSLQETSLELAAYVGSRDEITVENNTFLNTPGDAVDIGAGTVSGNYFSGAGYTTLYHPDAIWVSGTTGPVVISDNFIDWTMNANSTCPTNDCIRITTELGNAENITVTGNYLIGGATVIDAGNTGTDGIFSNITISDNYIGFGAWYDFAVGPQTGVTETDNVIFDFTNTAYSTNAWAAYEANGIVTDSLVTATAADSSISAAAKGTTTLYGNGEDIHLYGGSSETIFVGGAGVQYDWGGSGKNIYTYLSVADSTYLAPDLIGNFNVATDVIDLHAINANPASSSTVNFTYIGSAAFSSAGGEVRVVQDVADDATYVEADLVGDSSADLLIRLGGIVNLTAANFALTTAQYNADIAAYTTAASFESSQSSLNQVAGGFSIVDSAANIQPELNALEADASNINAVTSTDGALAVTAATFVADETILNKFVGGFAIVDTGAHVGVNMSALEKDAAAITSVTLSDSTAVAPDILTLSTFRAKSDAAILAKIQAPYVLDVVGSAGTTVTGEGFGLTINVGVVGKATAPVTVTGGGAGDTFTFSANFGVAQITDFAKYEASATPDAISLSTRDFANWSTLLADAHASGANTILTSADGANLTLDGVSLSSLQNASAALKSEFKFHA